MDGVLWFVALWCFGDWVRKWVVNTALAIDDARRIGFYDPDWKPPVVSRIARN
jgi:hypothetical protein